MGVVVVEETGGGDIDGESQSSKGVVGSLQAYCLSCPWTGKNKHMLGSTDTRVK